MPVEQPDRAPHRLTLQAGPPCCWLPKGFKTVQTISARESVKEKVACEFFFRYTKDLSNLPFAAAEALGADSATEQENRRDPETPPWRKMPTTGWQKPADPTRRKACRRLYTRRVHHRPGRPLHDSSLYGGSL